MATKRSGKFYRRNEEEVMKLLGLEPTPNSGSGWVVKEDGQNENVICQLKSTDAKSIKITQLDLHKLEYNASVTNKIPVFAIQFLKNNEVYLIMKPEVLEDATQYIKTGEYESSNEFIGIDLSDHEDITITNGNIISSSNEARMAIRQEYQNKYKKERKSAT